MLKVSGFNTNAQNLAALNEITIRLAAKDPTLWGESAAKEASVRLDWIDLPESSRALLPKLDALSAWSRALGHKHFILCGMGGSSLAPEVIAAHHQKELTVLDSTNPDQVAAALALDLTKTCIIIASKSGSTIETSSQRSLFVEELAKLNLPLSEHLVVVTDPGSLLETFANEVGAQLVLANPKVGGRFSALSAFGLVPAALIGVDVSILLDDALMAAESFTEKDSSVVQVAAALAQPESQYPEFFDKNSNVPGIADWIEQLIAESTGKDGVGVLPVVLHESKDVTAQTIQFLENNGRYISGPLGAQFIFWEWVTALLCYLLKVDPFNQPNVTEAKDLTNKCLSGDLDDQLPVFEDENMEIYAPRKMDNLGDYLELLNAGSYIAVMAYLNRPKQSEVIELQTLLARRFKKPVTFGWGPRFLHSTGQFHKGGPLVGAFLQLTSEFEHEVLIPGASYDFAELINAQTSGDYAALAGRNLPVVRIHLKNEAIAITKIKQVIS